MNDAEAAEPAVAPATDESLDLRLRNVRKLSAGFRGILCTNCKDWWAAAKFRREQGLLINLMRLFFVLSILIHFLVFLPAAFVVGHALCLTGCIYVKFWRPPRRMTPDEYGHETFRLSTDLYMYAFTVALIWAYLLAVVQVAQPPLAPGWRWVIRWPPFIITCVRLYEVFSFNAALHTQRSYYTRAPMRALVNTIWHYAEVVVAFATLFLMASILENDNYGGMTTHGDIITQPLYFSFVTITTLGYGDYSPTGSLGQCLVALEVLLGLVMLVIVIQRVLSTKGAAGGENRDQSS